MKKLERAFRKDLVKMLSQSEDSESLRFTEELKAAGQYTEATEDEICRFLDVLDSMEAA